MLLLLLFCHVFCCHVHKYGAYDEIDGSYSKVAPSLYLFSTNRVSPFWFVVQWVRSFTYKPHYVIRRLHDVYASLSTNVNVRQRCLCV